MLKPTYAPRYRKRSMSVQDDSEALSERLVNLPFSRRIPVHHKACTKLSIGVLLLISPSLSFPTARSQTDTRLIVPLQCQALSTQKPVAFGFLEAVVKVFSRSDSELHADKTGRSPTINKSPSLKCDTPEHKKQILH